MRRNIISLFLTIFMLINYIPSVSAYNFPHEFWDANSKYENALFSNNYRDIIKYGNRIIDIMAYAEEGKTKQDVLISRYKSVGLAYAALGEYTNSTNTFEKLYNYALRYSDKQNYAKEARARVKQYKSDIKVYTDKGTPLYYGAKNEKRNGVLFGTCFNGQTRSLLENESMILTYKGIEEDLIGYSKTVFRAAEASGCAVEYALNCMKEGADIRSIKDKEKYLKKISDMFEQFSDVPIYLRFAAEFDVWQNQADPEAFKSAFRYVSQYFKSRNSNVAIVWSPNQVSGWYIDIDDYYPGDEYVDWVGMSLYAQPYFLGDKNSSEGDAINFRTGINSDPVIAARDIIEKYGDRKPIMISESGCGHRLVKSGEDTSDFAMQRLKEYMSYLPMVYPQIKLMAYFDHYVDAETEKNDYRLSTNAALQDEYLRLTKGERFIQDSFSNSSDFCYREVGDGTYVDNVFSVSCYAHRYNTNVKSVTYFIDDNYAAVSTEIPFTAFIDAGGYQGRHTLKTIASFDNGKYLVSESEINIGKPEDDITVELSGKRLSFDREPVLYNNRTMVPMRKIFESLGADVSWDNTAQTASGRRGDRTVKLTVGSRDMFVNHKKIRLDTPPIIIDDRTLVPVRAVAEGMGCDVDWLERNSTVTIEPKVFTWSEWRENIPNDVDEDLYYIEQKTQYRGREEYETVKHGSESLMQMDGFLRREAVYGEWSNWSRTPIIGYDPSKLEVETRSGYEPPRYHFAHYCTGDIGNLSKNYRTGPTKWCDESVYHDLGWFDEKLPEAEDTAGTYVQYDSEGNKIRCENGCFRWYIIETDGGSYTEYRSRNIDYDYYFRAYTDWSEWLDDYPRGADQTEERTMFRYKEK